MSQHTWAKTLKRFNEECALREGKPESDDEKLLGQFYIQLKGAAKGNGYTGIPRFYAKPLGSDTLQQRLRDASRTAFAQRRSSEIMDNEELQTLWAHLEDKNTPPVDPDSEEQMISYTELMEIKENVSDKCKEFFTATIFAKLLRDDPYGRVSVSQFFSYVMRKVWLQQTRIGLGWFDGQGLGYLKEPELESYILELMPTLTQLKWLEKTFYPFYVCTAVRKFFFFLDPMHTGKIRIQDILACGFLDDLLELRDEDTAEGDHLNNWFSAHSAHKVYGQYIKLDDDHNGMLNRRELLGYGLGTLTKPFIDRVFQECLTYGGEVDYKTYLDFVLAMENKKEPQALQYIFRLLDIEGKGYLSTFSLKFFFKASCRLKSEGHSPVNFEDVKDEIFDMVKPKEPQHITLQDLINSGQGATVISILIDLNGFLSYENREMLLAGNEAIG
ncbi:hypothetical protein EMCRGX_G033105 [Ephydatia muelleri]